MRPRTTSLTLLHGAALLVVAWVTVEGLARKALPELSTPIVAAKFPLLAGLYAWLLLTRWHVGRRFPIPRPFQWFLLYGTALAAYQATQGFAETHLIGILVNLAFVPMALVGAELFAADSASRWLMRLIVLLAIGAAGLGAVQSQLHWRHWLNAAAADEDKGAVASEEGLRIDATFSHTSVYAGFGIAAALACGYVLLYDASGYWRFAAVPAAAIVLAGTLLTGSRKGFFGALLIGAVFAGPPLWQRVRDRRFGLGQQVAGFLAAVGLGYAALVAMSLDTAAPQRFRATSTESFFDRITGYYLTHGLENAYDFGGPLGAGWGPLTQGAARYSEAIGGVEYTGFDNESLVGEYQAHVVEGGYACLLFSVGVVGLALFLWGHGQFFWPRHPELRWRCFGAAIGLWSLVGNLPFALQETGVLAILWWLFAGIYWSKRPF